VHVESGLRSFNRLMPEEINRIATDHVSDLLFAPTRTAMELLAREGLEHRSVFTGDVGYDAVLFNRQLAEKKSTVLEKLGLTPRKFAVLTVHRSENTESGKLTRLLGHLAEAAGPDTRIVFPIHPRTAGLLPRDPERFNQFPGMRLIKPVGFLDMLQLVSNARMVFTDSGGVQKEAFFLGTPCVTLREETEWTETVHAGANLITGLDRQKIIDAAAQWHVAMREGKPLMVDLQGSAPFGRGDAARRVIDELVRFVTAS